MPQEVRDLFNLTQEECICLAKRNIVDCIYSSAKIEGIAVTFLEIREIYEGRSVAGLTIDDISKINNLKHAWKFIFDTIDYPLDFLYVRQLNQIVNTALMLDAGQVRNYDVRIGGTSWKPEIPDTDIVRTCINDIMRTSCITKRAIDIMLYIMRTQIFSDGNKRTAQLAANQILVQNGKGYLLIPEEKNAEFFGLLLRFYETGDRDNITNFLLQTSVWGKKIVKIQEDELIDAEMFKIKSLEQKRRVSKIKYFRI